MTKLNELMFDSKVGIRPATPQDIEALAEMSKADNHGLFYPTHVVTKNGEMVGWVSMGVVPTVLVHLHTQKVEAPDTLAVASYIQTTMRGAGAPAVLVPCQETSPLFKHIAKDTGCVQVGQMTLFVKTL